MPKSLTADYDPPEVRFMLYRFALILLLGSALSAATADLALVTAGKASAGILVVNSAPDALEAAQALRTYVQKMSGVELALQEVAPEAKTLPAGLPATQIVITTPEHLKLLKAPAAVSDLARQIKNDGFALWSDGKSRLLIVAPKPVALLYGAYEVLERLGCRWYFPGELGEEIPSLTTLALPALSEVQNPDMVDRNMWYAYGGRPAWQSEGYKLWQTRNKMGGVRFSAGHNLYRVVPVAQFGKTHPEYYPLWGDRRHVPAGDENHGWQPCTSNPEVIALAVAAADKFFTENPDAASFSLSPNDGYGWCQCDKCLAQDPPEQRQQRNQFKGRRTLIFVNAVAKAIAPKHPGKFLAWYAYAGTVEPPTDVKAEPNVLTALAHYGYVGCNVHGMADTSCPNNQKFMGIMDGWSKAADRLMIREYWSLLCSEESAMARVCAGYSLAEDLPLLVKRGFIAASAESEPEYGSSAINFYLAAKLMWNSRQALEPLLVDYYRGMYGPAAAPMREFFTGILTRCRALGSRGPFFEDKEYPAMAAELQKAAETPGLSEKQRGRIAMTQEFLRYVTLLHDYNLKPLKATREQIEALVAEVEAKQAFTLDTVMHKHAFAAQAKPAAIKDAQTLLVGKLQLASPSATLGPKSAALAPTSRGRHVYGLLVGPSEHLQAEITLRRLGRYTNPAAWLVLDEAGKQVAEGAATLEEASKLDVPTAGPGSYTLITDPSSNACRVTSPLRGLALAGRNVHLLGGQPPLYFVVPADTKSFWIMLETDAPGETGLLQILDPKGAVVATGDTVTTGQTRLEVQVPAELAGQVWGLRLGAAATGVCEDLKLSTSENLPPLLSTDAARVLQPAK